MPRYDGCWGWRMNARIEHLPARSPSVEHSPRPIVQRPRRETVASPLHGGGIPRVLHIGRRTMSMNKRTVKFTQNTNSGHGAFGMGGQPTDDPRDQNSGGRKRADD